MRVIESSSGTSASAGAAATGPRAAASALETSGWAVAYRLYDVGYAIDLDRAAALAPAGATVRLAPRSAQALALRIPNPPLLVNVGPVPLGPPLDGVVAQLSARLYDFGTIALRARIRPGAERLPWTAFSRFGRDVERALRERDIFEPALRALTAMLAPAIARPRVAAVTEDYTVFRLTGLWDAAGERVPPAALHDQLLTPLLLQEEQPLSESARRELLPHRLSYYEDDLTVLTWEHALALSGEPAEESDVEWVLEFANAQLLELRYYSAALDDALPRMYDDIARARRGARAFFTTGFARVLARLYELFADTTETVERVDNALSVTDDVYLARVYTAAMEVFRGRAWRSSIDRKLAIIRETYGMLNAEAQSRRSEMLETMIILLIIIEIVLAVR